MPEIKLTAKQVCEVPCIVCNATVGQRCVTNKKLMLVGYHRQRAALRAKMPVLRSELNATDKALIVYYAFVMLADSVSTKSVEMLGASFTSADIQRYFGQKAIDELKKDGLL